MHAPLKLLKPDPHIFLPQSSYQPSHQYHDQVSALLPKIWRLKQESFWTHAMSPSVINVAQGWKIHVSAIHASAADILSKVVPICVEFGVDFKFASDPKILTRLLSKNCARGSGGKFITIYPPSLAVFKAMLAALYGPLQGEQGPHILSDMQYQDSRVLHYRYGGFHRFPEIDVDGGNRLCILNDQFEFFEDARTPRFSLPDFVSDPFEQIVVEPEEVEDEDAVRSGEKPLFGEKYEILHVIKFSNAGGVYYGRNVENQEASIVKEARPFVGADARGNDAIVRLQKEFRILGKISDLNICPRPFDFFKEWDHCFLATEFIEGITLRQYVVKTNRLIHGETSGDALKIWLDNAMKIAVDLLDIFVKLHGRNIIFGDLSLNNVMINPETLALKLIDFECALEPGIDASINMFTPGYGTEARLDRVSIEFSDDYYALGCTLLALIAPNVTLIQKREDFVEVFFSEVAKEIDLPEYFITCVKHLLDNREVDLVQIAASLRQGVEVGVAGYGHGISMASNTAERDVADCRRMLKAIYAYQTSVMDTGQSERVFPVGSALTDPMTVDHGMLGIAYVWHQVNKELPPQFDEWIRRRFHAAGQRPGLMNGLAGAAWVLASLGRQKMAVAAIKSASLHPLLFQKMSLGHGAAGYGLANLYFWQQTGSEAYLTEAIRIADIVCEAAIPAQDGCAWEDPAAADGAAVGLLTGASGIALFLLYAYRVTGTPRYLETGEQGLRFDMACGRRIEGGIGFPRHSAGANSILLPYLAYGSAGVGSVALRFYMVTKRPMYRDFIDAIKVAVAQKYSVSPDLFTGLAGMGNYLLDAHQMLDDDSYLGLAHRLSHGLKLFELPRETGSAFVALDQAKISSDYACGAAGIALFLHRLQGGGPNLNFMLDHLLDAD